MQQLNLMLYLLELQLKLLIRLKSNLVPKLFQSVQEQFPDVLDESETITFRNSLFELTNNLISGRIASIESELEKISKEIIEEVKAAADFALESKFPSSEELYTDVYI